jgi:hypothetical protein
MNKKGFVVSAVLYPLLVIFLALIMGFLSMSDTRKRILDKMKLEITGSIFDDASCSCDTILNKLNYLIKHGVGGSGSTSAFGELNITAYETASDMPAVGSVNDIAIITDTEITNYYLTPYEPSTIKEGVVLLQTDEDYYALLEGDNIAVPVRVAYQYIDSAWVNVQTFVYTQSYGWTALYYAKYYTEYLLNGADPELYDGLVPIQISDAGVITKADVYTEWYSYEDKIWANAVLVNNPSIYEAGDVISESDILMYFVWIPRYKYKLFNAENGSIDPLQIEITFENNKTTKSNGTKNNEWLTHPAFTFGTTELNGMWVAKFEATGSTTALRSKPGVQSLRSITVYNAFTATRNMELTYSSTFNLTPSQIDTHMMKNMEWGAMAYLSHSAYGTCTNGTCTEISVNTSSYYTGASSSTTAWASTYVKQSTTANKYGIYDTSGGAYEYVMGNVTSSTTVASSTYFYSNKSGFSSPPADKYIDYYTYDTNVTSHARGKLGDATKETLTTFGSKTGGWYDDYTWFPDSNSNWFVRNGLASEGTSTCGIFEFGTANGNTNDVVSFRIVLTAE